MSGAPPAVERLVKGFARLPGIGRKTSQRLVFHLLRVPREQAVELADALVALKDAVGYCSRCFHFAEEAVCAICSDPRRDPGVICVVEEPQDVLALERAGGYRGVYHVLGGTLSPLDGIGPEDLRIAELEARLEAGAREAILALNPNVEGEALANYLADRLRPAGMTISRIARGVPVGSDLELADQLTLARALEGRQRLN
jgi:recombination protein RecR